MHRQRHDGTIMMFPCAMTSRIKASSCRRHTAVSGVEQNDEHFAMYPAHHSFVGTEIKASFNTVLSLDNEPKGGHV